MPTAPVDRKYHDGVLCLLRSVIAKNRVRHVGKKKILTGLQSRLESNRVIQQQEVTSGFSRMQCCREALSYLDENGWRRSYHQRLFHDDFVSDAKCLSSALQRVLDQAGPLDQRVGAGMDQV